LAFGVSRLAFRVSRFAFRVFLLVLVLEKNAIEAKIMATSFAKDALCFF
jgi:hypothetical protein